MAHERVDWNPNYDIDDSWARDATHYKVTLKRPGKRMTTYFSMGAALRKPPTAEEVLDDFASEAAGVENNPDFESWAREYDYDPDSREAERLFRKVEKLSERLKDFLDDEAYEQLLWKTERE